MLWIVVDTLRADHLEWYGYGRETSPEWAPLVRGGTLFELAITPQPETSPAIASLLTGRYPPAHGVRALYQLLHDDNTTAAEIFSQAGYETAAFVSSFVMIGDFTNFRQGFGVYDDFVAERELSRYNFERRAGDTLELVRRWLAERDGERPFFLFVHLIDPHGPYDPPGSWATRFRSDETFPVPGKIAKYQRLPGVEDFATYRDRYDGEIAYLSSELGRFLGSPDAAGALDDALIVLTADHGESLGERDRYFRHGDNVFQENLHVPLVIRPPTGGHFQRGGRRPESVSLVDILPTSLALARIPPPSGLDGVSLVPLLEGRDLAARSVYAWSRPAGPVGFAALDGHRKSMLRRDVEPEERWIFDLASDPDELHPLPATLERLAERWVEWRDRGTPFVVESNLMEQTLRADFVRERLRERDRADLERLRALGYIN